MTEDGTTPIETSRETVAPARVPEESIAALEA